MTVNNSPSWLPSMLSLDGAWEDILAYLYEIFTQDFIQGQPTFENRQVWWNRRVLPGEKYEEGFWHVITKIDYITKQRLPDYRRAERLPWCAPTINYSSDNAVKVWDHKESNRKIRTYLWLEDLDYVIILEKRRQREGEIAFLVTAFYVKGKSAKHTLEQKYARRC